MLPRAPGTYALLLACPTGARIRIGRLGIMRLRPGYYIYVGSAFGPGGLRARIGHHQRAAWKPHWHIDYLRKRTCLEAVWYISGVRCEHEWGVRIAALSGADVPLPGFGSSDCKCAAHLFWLGEIEDKDVGWALGRDRRSYLGTHVSFLPTKSQP